ncbi:UDP-N-acetylmuramoyl-L-alanyl-D-glutamate--2,6-diaminopimelate ligase [Cupriavidus necator]|uniref:UDP-N-acetylmuramoyl-L-alanyl-D-glutamate--2,6-diaminopimelate ligase n=1 Tax=Cupriavidus necator (strain ATCC 17699 / DSM 428 / KCTC 22496 / NCIMB 10442 / H16 / Stanier 337) TaxID=381666 RepID=Q0K6L9_CUPNH|nr:UDP-N-acetylmuramoyl-L-alanyl-D-glutamate--2,6-diaminopimelate ligase [Cupriavidus necator]QCC02725.1 UDP-N-acetylmuramoyl-L-alanyl-D-glutamate--2,6-diaminopimelate ligase [Cupriavidus necator H16]QQB78595.1 UDP-N-acetylmuramoyl-L-alanyl-D-glutamate--2,6-diaminopimelate ligase [Cupriavidus necator]WKA42818.1 UDP-N-acetylmuramoyl-L-alanyl-D-glutamate--2,6-diaminopimelate ligase [Cupriavidus necator]CAJ94352.1 UDP-N-acetylmuramoylalanyl-D-glutamate 2,6-diaminopimelate ligase [Cupriavidus necat
MTAKPLLPLEVTAQASNALAWLRTNVAAAAQLTGDTRRLARGDVFFAYVLGNARLATDGRLYIAQAIAAGAGAIVYEADGFDWPFSDVVPHLAVSHLHQLAGPIAAGWHGNPVRGLAVTGITGTNGKTSCSQWLARVLQAAGTPCATIGTLGTGFPGALQATGFTTPDAVQLQASLASLHDAGARAVAMEVSSHGLEQERVAGTHFSVAVLTNLTQDHLDYHGSMAEYEAAKESLFRWDGLRTAVVNRDDAMGQRLLAADAAAIGAPHVIEYGIDGPGAATVRRPRGEWLRATNVRATPTGTAFHIDGSFGSAEMATPMIGAFNVSNLLAVLGAALANGVAWDAAIAALRALTPVEGRMELFGAAGGPDAPLAVVDYAHTPDALAQTLAALRPVAQARNGRLWCVFGCGGDRDPIKRPLMGAVAEREADEVILTSDNPRSEDPQDILDAIADGMAVRARARQIEDRAAAILYAVRHAAPADVVLVAGKGHEATQEIQGRKRPFSDREHVRLALATRGVSA